MLKHLIVFYYIMSLMSGATSMVLTIVILIKLKSKIILQYFIFLILLTMFVLINTFIFYFTNVINFENTSIEIIITILFFLTFAGLIFLGNTMIFNLLDTPFPFSLKILNWILTSFSLVLLAIPFIITENPKKILDILWFELYNIYVNLFYADLIGMIVYCIVKLKQLPFTQNRNLLKLSLILIVFGLPIFILDSYWEFFQLRLHWVPRRMNFLPFFYIVWNALSIYYSFKIFFMNPVAEDLSQLNLSTQFIDRFKLSDRELEIIKLAIQGLSNTQIGEKIFISSGTVKNHLYHIYQKTNVKNKIELLNLIRKTH